MHILQVDKTPCGMSEISGNYIVLVILYNVARKIELSMPKFAEMRSLCKLYVSLYLMKLGGFQGGS